MRFGLEHDLNDGDDKRQKYYDYNMIVLSNYNQFNIHLHIIWINYKFNLNDQMLILEHHNSDEVTLEII